MIGNKQKGFALVLSLVLLLAMSLMGGALIVIASSDHQGNNSSDEYQQTFYVAETAMMQAEKSLIDKMMGPINTASGTRDRGARFIPRNGDSDGDGVPDKTDVDDDNDGIMDQEEACLIYLLDGNSFESYWKPGQPVNSSENKNSSLTSTSTIVVPPWRSVNGDGEIWDSANVNSTQWDPHQGTYFIELLQNGIGYNDLSYWNETTTGSGTFDRIFVEQDVYPS